VTERIALRLAEQVNQGSFESFFGQNVTLVAAPGHAPTRSGRQLSGTVALVKASQDRGLGTAKPQLHRVRKVKKAAWCPPGERPTFSDHYQTIRVAVPTGLAFEPVNRITIIDDVVTTGSTLFACAAQLKNGFPHAEILAFAAIRSLSSPNQIREILNPVENRCITLGDGGSTRRKP